jgi:hypothetical protein
MSYLFNAIRFMLGLRHGPFLNLFGGRTFCRLHTAITAATLTSDVSKEGKVVVIFREGK